MPCPPRRPARASASTAQSYPCLTPVLCAASPCARRFFPAPRGKGGYWQGASACRARRVALRAAARVLRTALSLRAAGFARPPREGRILAGIQRPPASSARPNPARRRVLSVRVSCAPPPAFPVWPIPAPARVSCAAYPCAPRVPPAAGFFLRSAGRADIGSEPARALSAARRVALRPPARVPCAAYPCAPHALPARVSCAPPPASPVRPIPARRGFCPPPVFACAPRERRILAASQRVPCPPASSAQPYPSVPRVLSVRRGKGGYWQGASACRARRVTLRARPHPLRSPIPACRRFFPALRRPRPLCGLTLRAPAFPVRPIPARRPPPPARRPAASARCHRAAARPPRWPRRASGPPRPRAIYRAWTWPRAGPSTA